jgi:superfamily I DNA/RNA helicase
VRLGGDPPSVERVERVDDVAGRAIELARARAEQHTSVGVVAADVARPAIVAGVGDLDAVQVVAPAEAKGLEFDAVVVVEPAAVAASAGREGAGLRLLYVALTRAVQHLDVVHAGPLPAPLVSRP